MKTEHTPGPWIFADEPIDGEEDIVIEHEGFPLAKVRGTNDMSCLDDDDEIERINQEVIANALLIAAAPDLLQALEKALPGIEELNGEFQEGWESTIDLIKKAIEKAKGKSQ